MSELLELLRKLLSIKYLGDEGTQHIINFIKSLKLPDNGIIGQVLTMSNDGPKWENPQLQEAPQLPEIPQAMWMKDTDGSKTGLKPIGVTNNVSGNYAFTGGYNTVATGTLATTFGQGTLSQNKTETSFNQFNESKQNSTTFGDSDNTLFTVGNGTGTSTRHNALEIRENGDIYFPDIKEGTNFYQQTMRRLQDIPKVWKGTWEEYSKIENLDDNTMYYIYEDSIKNLYPEDQLNNFGSYQPKNVPGVEFELYEDNK